MKKVTIKEVAKEAGVSITTVSHALSGGGALRQETRDRVMEIAKQMHYTPDWRGRNLKSMETKTIGFFTASIRGYYGILADAMYEKCRENGYEMDIFMADEGEALLHNLMGNRVDGAVILHNGFNEAAVETLQEAELPVVFLDREVKGKYMASVLLDSYGAGRMLTEYLFTKGHKRLMFLQGEETYDGKERFRGFCDALGEYKLPFEEKYCLYGGFNQEIAYQSMQQFLEKGEPLPEAIFAANDESAFGCIKALGEAGIKVPAQISVVGCDNIEISKWYMPPLTTVDTNITQQGICAANFLVSIIKQEETGRVEKIKGKMIERKSVREREE